MSLRALLLCVLPACGGTVTAQETEPLFHPISLEQGLSDDRVTAIVQDRYGFMWFGTANGLNRYDGYNMKVYTSGKNGLDNSGITTLFRSKGGALYVSDGRGLLEYNHAADSFARPLGTDSSELNKERMNVTLMAEDAVGRIYIGCAEGLFRYTPARRAIEDLNTLCRTTTKVRAVSGMSFGPDGRLWITTQKVGFFILNPATNSVAIVPHDTQYGSDTCCYAIHRTVFLDHENLLVGQHSFGLTVLNTRTLQFTAQKGALGRNDSVRFNAVYRLIRDYKGRVWGGTDYHGLIQYVPATKGIIHYPHDPFNPYSYGGYRILALYEDREHNIWIGTGGYGVFRFNPDKGAVRHFPWNPNGYRSPPGTEVLSAAVRDSASVWIGTDKGPAIFYPHAKTFQSYRYENSYNPTLPGSNINVIHRGADGLWWFASRHLGISRFSERSGQFLRYTYRDGNLPRLSPQDFKVSVPANYMLRIINDPNGNLVMLINGGWISIFNPITATSQYRETDSASALFRLKDVRDILRLGDTLFIGTQSEAGGTQLQRWSFTGRHLSRLLMLDSSGALRIRSMSLMRDGNIALASSNGVYAVSRAGRIVRHDADSIHRNILSVISGLPGVLWVCSDRHIGRVDLQTGSWMWLGADDGIRPSRFFGEAFRLLPDGRIVAGSGNGLFLINPAAISRRSIEPPVLVDFRVFGQAIPLPHALQDEREIRLTHEQAFFSFSMSTLRYAESSNTEYSYKLAGFDRDWQPAGSDRNGQYTGVPGGTYTLMLRARSGGEAWVEAAQGIRIIVSRPWWGTWGFRAAVLLLLAALVVGVYYYRVRAIRKEARLRSDYEIRLNELEMSALRTQMNPHFIFNCLNTINSYINSNQKTQANHYITRFAKLIRLILENSRQRRVPLGKELEALHLYFQLESLRFEERFNYSIDVDSAIDTDNVEVPPLVLQPFVENAILHGILPRPGTGNISVRIRQKDSLVECVVKDDGIGRAEAAKRSAEGALQKESHGMAITQKRIGLFNREHGVDAAVMIEDLANDGIAAGTRVIIPLALVEGF